VLLRLSEHEYEVLAKAAGPAGLTPSGYAAEAALAAARAGAAPGSSQLRAVFEQLLLAGEAAHRIGVNLNQAVKKLNATGQMPVGFTEAVEAARRTVGELDGVAQDARDVLRHRR